MKYVIKKLIKFMKYIIEIELKNICAKNMYFNLYDNSQGQLLKSENPFHVQIYILTTQ